MTRRRLEDPTPSPPAKRRAAIDRSDKNPRTWHVSPKPGLCSTEPRQTPATNDSAEKDDTTSDNSESDVAGEDSDPEWDEPSDTDTHTAHELPDRRRGDRGPKDGEELATWDWEMVEETSAERDDVERVTEPSDLALQQTDDLEESRRSLSPGTLDTDNAQLATQQTILGRGDEVLKRELTQKDDEVARLREELASRDAEYTQLLNERLATCAELATLRKANHKLTKQISSQWKMLDELREKLRDSEKRYDPLYPLEKANVILCAIYRKTLKGRPSILKHYNDFMKGDHPEDVEERLTVSTEALRHLLRPLKKHIEAHEDRLTAAHPSRDMAHLLSWDLERIKQRGTLADVNSHRVFVACCEAKPHSHRVTRHLRNVASVEREKREPSVVLIEESDDEVSANGVERPSAKVGSSGREDSDDKDNSSSSDDTDDSYDSYDSDESDESDSPSPQEYR